MEEFRFNLFVVVGLICKMSQQAGQRRVDPFFSPKMVLPGVCNEIINFKEIRLQVVYGKDLKVGGVRYEVQLVGRNKAYEQGIGTSD